MSIHRNQTFSEKMSISHQVYHHKQNEDTITEIIGHIATKSAQLVCKAMMQ
jgi:hypothetical protein